MMDSVPAPTSPPLPNTYWVLPKRMLAGEYPSRVDAGETRERLARLREAGVDYFIDLTGCGEVPEYHRMLPAQTRYLRCTIADTEVPEQIAQMRDIQARIRAALTFGRCVYIHCRAGIGRTGLVVGCFLVERGMDGKTALQELNRLWRQSARSLTWPRVPQTREQADYILGWPQHSRSRDGGGTGRRKILR